MSSRGDFTEEISNMSFAQKNLKKVSKNTLVKRQVAFAIQSTMTGNNRDRNLNANLFKSAGYFTSSPLDLRRTSIEHDIICRILAHSLVHMHH